MVTMEDIKGIVILEHLTDPMKEKLLLLTDHLVFEENESVFQEGEQAERFYMVKRGKILLEKRISDHITVSFDSVKPGESFGWSTILDKSSYSSDAVSAETTEVFSVRREKLMALLDADHSMGYILAKQFLRVVRNRHERLTEQFMRAIRNHPDLRSLIKFE